MPSKVTNIPEGNLEIPRETTLKFISETNNENITLQFDKFMGDVVIRQFNDDTKETVKYASYLKPAEISEPLLNTTSSSLLQTSIEYLVLGIEHIVPKGLDHILFVIGIFFYSLKLKSLIGQVTMFTIAHSLTLILASLNIIYIPAFIIEPLIALSISYIAFENILQKKLVSFRLFKNLKILGWKSLIIVDFSLRDFAIFSKFFSIEPLFIPN